MSTSLSGSEEPLDPEAARLAAKVRLLMLVSALTTVVAVGAVLVVIGYRVFKAEGSAGMPDVTAGLPKGARIRRTHHQHRRGRRPDRGHRADRGHYRDPDF
jgi:hypothetical protein